MIIISFKSEKLMYLFRLFRVILLLFFLQSIGFLFPFSLDISNKSNIPALSKNDYLDPISIQGLKLRSFKDSRLITKASVKELRVNPRKIFIFNIRPINECTLNEVILEIYKNKAEPSGIAFGSLLQNISSGKGQESSPLERYLFGAVNTGLITRGIINDLVLKIYNKNKLSLIVIAPKAYLNFKKNEVIFQNARVEDIDSKKIIKSRRIVFKNGEGALRVPGEYVLFSPTGSTKGEGLIINL